jgi:hypothetical protein
LVAALLAGLAQLAGLAAVKSDELAAQQLAVAALAADEPAALVLALVDLGALFPPHSFKHY